LDRIETGHQGHRRSIVEVEEESREGRLTELRTSFQGGV
jgi:hypothetical protein